jgi:hypothetical protein
LIQQSNPAQENTMKKSKTKGIEVMNMKNRGDALQPEMGKKAGKKRFAIKSNKKEMKKKS